MHIKSIVLSFTLSILLIVSLTLSPYGSVPLYVNASEEGLPSSLYSKYCALIDGDSKRLLYGKDFETQVPMASTTKIMTCYVTLTQFDLDSTVTTSKYAASMPDVQLNAVTGQQFRLKDLLYSLMLKSHNDSAVVIAENCAYFYLCDNDASQNPDLSNMDLSFLTKELLDARDSSCLSAFSLEQSQMLVRVFTTLMNQQAKKWDCTNTYYITPNGLDAEDENGVHSTTAYELAVIMSHCIESDEFNEICQTKSYSFSDLTGKQNYTVGNANAFLDMYDNIIAGKTGFTGNAGYCYVCAYQADGRTFVVALLACGWPSNKTYKWKDARLLLNYGREHYYKKEILSPQTLEQTVSVSQGVNDSVALAYNNSYSCLLSDHDIVNVVFSVPDSVTAPVCQNEIAGKVSIYINDILTKEFPIYFCDNVRKLTFLDKFNDILNQFLLCT